MKKILPIPLLIICSIAFLIVLQAMTSPSEPTSSQIIFTKFQDQGMVQKRAVLELSKAIDVKIASPDPVVIKEGERLKSLAFDLNPTIYYTDGQVSNPSGKQPVCVESDVVSLSKLYVDNPEFSQVELLIVKISKQGDLSMYLQPDNLKSFTNLKYICVSSAINICNSAACEASSVSQMIAPSNNETFMILYEIAIPQ